MLFRGPEPAVEVMVNGQGPFLFAIDTGGTDAARADSSLVTRLGLSVTGSDTLDDGSGRDTVRVGTVRLDSLSLGGIEFRNVEAATRDYNRVGLPHIDGILAFDLFEEWLFTLDYPAKRVRLERDELPKEDGAEILRLRRVHGHPAVSITIGKREELAEIDSGNVRAGFLFPASLAEKLALATEPVSIGMARTGTHEFEVWEAQIKASISLGRHEFTHPLINYPAPFPFANMGSRALSQFVVTFDQRNDRVRFVRHAAE